MARQKCAQWGSQIRGETGENGEEPPSSKDRQGGDAAPLPSLSDPKSRPVSALIMLLLPEKEHPTIGCSDSFSSPGEKKSSFSQALKHSPNQLVQGEGLLSPPPSKELEEKVRRCAGPVPLGENATRRK